MGRIEGFLLTQLKLVGLRNSQLNTTNHMYRNQLTWWIVLTLKKKKKEKKEEDGAYMFHA